MGTIYQCLTKQTDTYPPYHVLIHEAQTEEEAIQYLQNNGGGIYRNILHGFDCQIDGVKNNDK